MLGATSTSVTLGWTAATDVGGPGIGGYLVYRNGGQIANVGAGVLTYTDTGLTPLTAYQYQVRAYDLSAQQGPLSNILNVTTPASAPLTITTTSLPSATVGVPYSYTMAATGGTPPYTWSLVSDVGSNNAWTVTSFGSLTCTPTTTEIDSAIVIKVQDSVGSTAQGTFSVTVSGGVLDHYPGGTAPDGTVFAGVTVTDPFSAYATWYLDGLNGTDTGTPGTDRRAAGYVYKTLQNAMLDVFYTSGLGARRIIVRPTATYNTNGSGSDQYGQAAGYFQSGGSGPSAQYVVQGDPASSTLPVFDNGAASASPSTNNFIDIGCRGYGPSGPGYAYTNNYITLRKLKFQNQAENDCIYMYNGSGSNIVVEYCSFQNLYHQSGTSSTSAVGQPSKNNNFQPVTIRNCVFNTWTASSDPGNATVVTTYGGDNWTISNNFFYNAPTGFRTKQWNSLVSPIPTVNYLSITNNIFSNILNCIATTPNQVPQDAIAPSNATITNNLAYGTGQFIYFNPGQPFGTQGSNILIANNTLNGTATGGGLEGADCSWAFATAVTVRDNLMLSSCYHVFTFDPSSWGAPFATVFSQLDYNTYAGAALWGFDGSTSYPYTPTHNYTSFSAWKAAAGAPDLVNIGSPDANGIWIPNLSASWNTIAKNLPNIGSGNNYTLAASSPLQTASSTGGPVGCNTSNIGPGWFA